MRPASRQRGARLALSRPAALLLAALAVPAAARADDALLLAPGLWRIYAVPSWTSVTATYDAGGARVEIPEGQGRIRSFNLGLAIEYGINRWLTVGAQWTPGANLSSRFDFPAGDPGHRDLATLDDSFDVLAGAKIGILGSPARDPRRATGLLTSERLRLAVGLGVKLPVTSIDWDREAERLVQGRPYLAQAVDRHLVAPVLGLHVDAVLLRSATTELFVNGYGQYIPYVSTLAWGDTSLARHLDPLRAGLPFDPRYDAYLEVEPRFERWVLPGCLRAGLYLPVRKRFLPAPLVDGVSMGGSGYRTTVAPTLDLLSLSAGIPLELKVACQLSVDGRNALATDTVSIILRVLP